MKHEKMKEVSDQLRQYETTIVIDSFQKVEDIKNIVSKIQNFIQNNGGKIDEIEEWGKKRLAYEINRKQYGNYVHILFTSETSLPGLLEREYRLEESILRYLTVIADPRAAAQKSESGVTEPLPAATAEPKPAEQSEKAESSTPIAEAVTEEIGDVKKPETSPSSD